MTHSQTVKHFPLNVEHFTEDALGLESFCRKLENYLNIEHDFVESSLVVSLNAEFGFGKSTFLKMWENDLADRLKGDSSTPMAINLNAWESDYYNEPLIPIISALVEAIEKQIDAPENDTQFQRLKNAAKDFAWFTLGMANSLIKEGLKVDVIEAGKLAEEKNKARKEAAEAVRPDLLDEYQKRRHALSRLKQLLKSYLEGNSPKAFIFIDELDRCRPDYAVSYLETIKHVFDIHGLIFVLAIDYDHLQNSAKSLYGSDLNFPGYFRKFVYRSFDLPEPSDANRKEFAKRLTDFYLHNKTSRFTKLNLNEFWSRILQIIGALKMNPRESMEFFRILGHTTGLPEEHESNYLPGYGIGLTLMCAFKVKRPELYKSLGKGKAPHKEVVQIFKQGFERRSAQWWFLIYLGGFTDRSSAYTTLESVNLLPENATEESIQKEVDYHAPLWESFPQNRYPQIYAQVESTELR